ncbi:helix-turn-helix transcriptional regulator [Geodermatophilus sp. DSM 44513]|uniref:ArsR/SmtB family transcription factor n=1 Tax=Geodermatophilus sp. DSM 44513 TaxID=1528104 RepID=UPI001274658A|nr:metalloregulator ArsR/SmtB family transcription factor [Geodermatophilus sp. DSM 44513]WNV76801.1 metalloregulator ArsR/SmtB family transcription factor [Geodermatophilus sp. DSM 44513]
MSNDRPQPHQHPVDPERVARARERLPSRDDAAALASILTLISDPTRSRVLYALDVAEELCVGDLTLALEVNEDAVGYALRVLRTAGLVANRREGRVVYYRLAPDFPEPLLEHCLWRLVALTRSPAADDAP